MNKNNIANSDESKPMPNTPEINVGRHTYTSNLKVNAKENPHLASLTIGSFCSIAKNVEIILVAEHRIDWTTTYPFSSLCEQAKSIPGHPTTKGDVVIGNDVWIAQDSIILSGVTIGDGAVIGARSVVTKDVPPYAIFAGNPARFIRNRFDDVTIKRLLKVKWWDWTDQNIADALPLMLSSDIEKFLDHAEEI